jgi:hypothetical protein
MDDILERRVPPPSLHELSDIQTIMSDMFKRFQRCYNDERDLVRIMSTRERCRCDDLQRARDENNYILARQENLLHRIRELTIERDEARQNVAVQSDELSHLRQEVCMHNATIIELKWKLATAKRQVPTERADVSSTALERTRPQRPPRNRRLALLAYVEVLTVSRAIAFSELARVRQEMGRLAVLSYMHQAHLSATGCRCNTYEAKCAEEWDLTYPLPNILEIRAMEEKESQGRPVCPPGPVVFHPGSTQDSLRKLVGNLSDYQVQTLRRCATMDPVCEARHRGS